MNYRDELIAWGLDPKRLEVLTEDNQDEVIYAANARMIDLLDILEVSGVQWDLLPESTRAHLTEAMFSAALLADGKLIEHMKSPDSHTCDKDCPMSQLRLDNMTNGFQDDYEAKKPTLSTPKPMDFGGEW